MRNANSLLQSESLINNYRHALPGKLAAIEFLIASFIQAKHQSKLVRELLRLVHNLIGSTGTYGLPEVCVKLRELETCIKEFNTHTKLDKKHIDRIWSHYICVRTAAQRCLSEWDHIESKQPVEQKNNTVSIRLTQSRLLLISDDDDFSKWIAKLCETNQHHIQIMERADDALDALQTEHFDFVLTEILLPSANGFEITKIIRQQFPELSFPIVFITSVDDEISKLKAIEAGGDAVLVKPVSFPMIEATLFALQRLRKRC